MISFITANSGIVGLAIFFGFFVVMILKLYRPGVKQVYDDFANIPFMEDSSDK